ncbi:threonine--tRNA ligase MST1 NDAI_0D04670 [Naumovozyma dairenensis CBS 421]|uniref:threonine--tRNA ligase n=1 Tax=Naumovozyma dairenensis (strain ATCC 10597 / BCRC 20456 / CBS 421 / NBRC 0211 / NRRL Y-12639) TaxID=1071378 RepID=G0WAG9_NAUDC|nr:hypothetical protein NDAI_0D04670 [Naumovozyma dairenensis CBS 421]CCD24780.1 hypothetical protein NDAI_0D04670 [Naumovozyma dairenensis CBS 421]
MRRTASTCLSSKKTRISRAIWFNNYSTKPPINTTSLLQEVSTKQKLFSTDPISPGSIFFLPNGTKIFNKLISFMKVQQLQPIFGFKEVITPLIYKKSLWEKSGHWANYKEDMFHVEGEDIEKETFGLKPMNCPGHCVIFNKTDHSYNELPIRYSDFSPLHRNEPSGSLSGLTRLRKFHQDDGHIFCTPEQVEQEILNCLKFIDLCYIKVFKLTNGYTINFSTRPTDHYIGELPVWNHAENVLQSILTKSGKPWELNEGDGVFYGPKLDIMIKDHNGKSHQVATIQLDFQLPERFDLKYKDADNTYKRPIMIHRAVFGSVERFLGLLIDQNKGKWPFWLNPYQVMIIPINTKNQDHLATAKMLVDKLRGTTTGIDNANNLEPIPMHGYQFNADLDDRSEPVGYRIKDAILKYYSYLIIIGDEEVKTGKFSVKERDNRSNLQHLTTDEIIEKFSTLEEKYM